MIFFNNQLNYNQLVIIMNQLNYYQLVIIMNLHIVLSLFINLFENFLFLFNWTT
jgi:hypothetical protein